MKKATIIKNHKGYLKKIQKSFLKHCGDLKMGDNVVFDIDGTLIDGKNPLHSIIKIYQTLLDRKCNIYIITARPENTRKSTLGQLKKEEHIHGIYGFKQLIMYSSPTSSKSLSTVRIFKQSARNSIDNIKFTIGDRWDDLEYAGEDIHEFSHDDSVVCNGFIKIFCK